VADLIIVGATGVLEGAGTVAGNLRDGLTGTVRAQNGTLTLTGDLSGTGKLQIADGGILDLQGRDPLGINFIGAAGVLRIEKTAAVTGTIGHLAVGDVIDLAGVTATQAGRVGGNLTVTKGDGSKLVLHVAGALTGNHFAISSDGAGGSNLTLTAPALLSDHFAFHPSDSITGSAELAAGHSSGIEPPVATQQPELASGEVFGFASWDHGDQINFGVQEGFFL
jgi:hypothetical protein